MSFRIHDSLASYNGAVEADRVLGQDRALRYNLIEEWKRISRGGSLAALSESHEVYEIAAHVGFKFAWSLNMFIKYGAGKSPDFDLFYESFTLPKRGTIQCREVSLPSSNLKSLQVELAQIFRSQNDWILIHHAAHAYEAKKSQFTNAAFHIGKELVACIDISSFFQSITHEMVKETLRRGRCAELSDGSLDLLASVCTYKRKLPIGVSTSPVLANAVLYPIDVILSSWAKIKNIEYTRFSDDLAFSGARDAVLEITEKAIALIESNGFSVNRSKTKLRTSAQRQIVTGVVVNKKIGLPREKRKLLRAMVHRFSNGGVVRQANRILTQSSLIAKLGFFSKHHPSEMRKLKDKLNISNNDHGQRFQGNALKLASRLYKSNQASQINQMEACSSSSLNTIRDSVDVCQAETLENTDYNSRGVTKNLNGKSRFIFEDLIKPIARLTIAYVFLVCISTCFSAGLVGRLAGDVSTGLVLLYAIAIARRKLWNICANFKSDGNVSVSKLYFKSLVSILVWIFAMNLLAGTAFCAVDSGRLVFFAAPLMVLCVVSLLFTLDIPYRFFWSGFDSKTNDKIWAAFGVIVTIIHIFHYSKN